jgi:heptosyltransferase-2
MMPADERKLSPANCRLLPMNVMIRVPNWVGDAVMAEPALRELRRIFKESHITFIARPSVAGLFDGENLYDDLLPVSTARGWVASTRQFIDEVRAIKEKNFDYAVLLTNSFRTALSARLAGARNLTGYASDGRGALLHTFVPREPDYGTKHQVFYYLRIATEVERRFDKDSRVNFQNPRPQLHTSAQSLEKARHLLEEEGIDIRSQKSKVRSQKGVGEELSVGSNRQAMKDQVSLGNTLPGSYVQIQNPKSKIQNRLVAINPGATNSRAKQWLAEKFAATADRFAECDGFQTLIIGAPGDVEAANQVARLMRTPVANLAGRTTIAELKAVLSLASLVVSNDTGAAHVGAALGVPTVVIFGPTEHFATHPLSDSAAVVRRDVDCSPCMLKDCPIDHRCMTRVQVDDVYEAAKQLLKD